MILKKYGNAPKHTTFIKSILQSYAAGNQILNELIQNSDDARASQVISFNALSEVNSPY